METNLLNSIIGIIFFAAFTYFGLKYASGKWDMPESKKIDYLNWTKKYGRTIKKGIVIISIIYGVSMLTQIINLIK